MMQLAELVARLEADYPELRFRVGKKFMFRGPRVIVYECGVADGAEFGKTLEQNNECCLRLLHEVGHAVSRHMSYRLDIERIKMEREAWEVARRLCVRYGVRYDEDFVEAQLDTYRDWLHRRSTCRRCGLVRYQAEDGQYHCPVCEEYGVGSADS